MLEKAESIDQKEIPTGPEGGPLRVNEMHERYLLDRLTTSHGGSREEALRELEQLIADGHVVRAHNQTTIEERDGRKTIYPCHASFGTWAS